MKDEDLKPGPYYAKPKMFRTYSRALKHADACIEEGKVDVRIVSLGGWDDCYVVLTAFEFNEVKVYDPECYESKRMPVGRVEMRLLERGDLTCQVEATRDFVRKNHPELAEEADRRKRSSSRDKILSVTRGRTAPFSGPTRIDD